MNELINKTFKRIASFIFIFIIFVYFTNFILSIPEDFDIEIEKGDICFSYPILSILNETNNRFNSLLKLDSGISSRNGRPLDYLVKEVFFNSLILLAIGTVFALIIGILKGILDSRKDNKSETTLKVLFTVIPISIPDIMIIAILQQLALMLHRNGLKIIDITGDISLSGLILPVTAISILPSCYVARITALAVEECYKKDYVKTAIGKGCSNFRVLWNHVMKNTIPIVVKSLPSISTILISNMLIVEYLFSYPGLSYSLFGFINKNDSNGIVICILLIGVIFFILDSGLKILSSFVKDAAGGDGI